MGLGNLRGWAWLAVWPLSDHPGGARAERSSLRRPTVGPELESGGSQRTLWLASWHLCGFLQPSLFLDLEGGQPFWLSLVILDPPIAPHQQVLSVLPPVSLSCSNSSLSQSLHESLVTSPSFSHPSICPLIQPVHHPWTQHPFTRLSIHLPMSPLVQPPSVH